MFGDHFYHAILRKSVAVFGTLFNNIYVIRRGSDNSIKDRQRVPLSYGPRQKFLARIEQQSNLDDPKVALKLPRMSFEITNLQYDSATKTSHLNKITTTSDESTRTSVRQMTPYILDMQLNIMAKNQDDALQILEQIVPNFQPVYNVSVKLLDDINKSFDVPITLTAVSLSDDYEGDFTTRRTLVYTLDFSMKIKFFGDTSRAGIITQVIANMFEKDTDPVHHYVTEYVEPFSAAKNYKTAKANASITNGVVTGITIVDGGSGYRAPPPIIFSQSITNATPTVNATLINGEISAASLVTNGFGYESVPNITISAPPAPQAAVAELTINEDGQVNSIGIAQESPTYQGYVNVPTVTIEAPVGIQAEISSKGSSLMAGSSTSFGNPTGLGYDDSVSITIPAPPISGLVERATATCTIDANGEIDSFTITDPGAYYNSFTTYAVSTVDPDTSQVAVIGTAILGDIGGGVYGVTDINELPHGNTYSSAPEIIINAPTADDSRAEVQSVATDYAGRISTWSVGGGQYYDPDEYYDLVIESPNDLQTAVASVTLDVQNGSVSQIQLTDGGKGYVTRPDITIPAEDPANYVVGEATCTIDSSSQVTSITITEPGLGYFPLRQPTFTFEQPSADIRATGTATITNGVVTDISIDNPGFGYETAPLISIEPPSPQRVIGDQEALLTYSFVKPDAQFTLYSTGIAQNPNSFYTVGERVYGSVTGSEGEVVSCVYESLNEQVVTVIEYITGYFLIGEDLIGENSGVTYSIDSYNVE